MSFENITSLVQTNCLQEQLPIQKRDALMWLMIHLIAILLLTLSTIPAQGAFLKVNEVLPAYAFLEGGSAVGNGGGTVVCRDPSTRVIKSAELLDFYEARVVRDFKIDISTFPGAWNEKAQGVINRLAKRSQLREQLYSNFLSTFIAETKFLSGVEFSKVPDSQHIGVPIGCEFEQAAIQIVPRFKGDLRYYINKDIWDALNDENKAGLVLHEMIYREALSYGHTDSIATRYFLETITSEAFPQMDFSDFMDLLMAVHFEQTDVPTMDPNIVVRFDPSRLWRAASTQQPSVAPQFNFKGAKIINLGLCMNEGCSDWKIIATQDGAVCSGVTEIDLPGKKSPIKIDFWFLLGEKCDRQLEMSESGSQLMIGFNRNPGVIEKGRIQYFADDGHRYEGNQIYFEASGKYILKSMVGDRFNNEYLSVDPQFGNKLETNCFINLVFENEKLRRLYVNGEDGDAPQCDPTVRIKKNPSLGIDLHFRLLSSQDNDTLHFMDGSYLSGGQLFLIESATYYPLTCEEQKPCMKIVDQDPNDINVIEFHSGIGQVAFDNQFDRADAPESCAVKDGIYDLYPGTLTPNRLVLRKSCNLKTKATDGAKSVFIVHPAGSVLLIAPDGEVTARIQ